MLSRIVVLSLTAALVLAVALVGFDQSDDVSTGAKESHASTLGARIDRSAYNGVWILDPEYPSARLVYGEVRVVEIDEAAVKLTVIDYGRNAVNLLPWTFRFDRWGPRRGPESSKAPLTRGRWSGDELVLTKTPGSPGGFVWVWNVSGENQTALIHEVTRLTWRHDFANTPTKGATTPYRRADPAVALDGSPNTMSSVQSLGTLVPLAANIPVHVADDGKSVSVVCIDFDCEIIEVIGGRRGRPRPLPRGQSAEFALPIEPPAEHTIISRAAQ